MVAIKIAAPVRISGGARPTVYTRKAPIALPAKIESVEASRRPKRVLLPPASEVKEASG